MKDYKSIEIETKQLDDYRFTDIDYIKIDVQFYELFVLEGATETLKINNPLLCIECARRNKEELEYVKKLMISWLTWVTKLLVELEKSYFSKNK